MNPAKNCSLNTSLAPSRTCASFLSKSPNQPAVFSKAWTRSFPWPTAVFLTLTNTAITKEIQEYVKLLKEGDSAIISEAGCPCVADPGADLVFLAHQNQIEIIPLVGPSSILLALMASGLNGQNFAFNGYLPKDSQERTQKIRSLEDRSFKDKANPDLYGNTVPQSKHFGRNPKRPARTEPIFALPAISQGQSR